MSCENSTERSLGTYMPHLVLNILICVIINSYVPYAWYRIIARIGAHLSSLGCQPAGVQPPFWEEVLNAQVDSITQNSAVFTWEEIINARSYNFQYSESPSANWLEISTTSTSLKVSVDST